MDYTSNDMFISKMCNYNHPVTIAFNYKDHSENTIMIKSKSVFFQNLVNHYKQGNLYFDTIQIKSDITSLIHRTNR